MGRTSPGVRVYLNSRSEFRKILLEKDISHKELSLKIGYCRDYMATVLCKNCLSYRASTKVAEALEVEWHTLFQFTEQTMQHLDDALFSAEELHLLKLMLAEYKAKREKRANPSRGRPKKT